VEFLVSTWEKKEKKENEISEKISDNKEELTKRNILTFQTADASNSLLILKLLLAQGLIVFNLRT